jgi:hypothetical protein
VMPKFVPLCNTNGDLRFVFEPKGD